MFDPIKVMGTGLAFKFTGMLKNSSGQNDACKSVNGPVVTCRTTADCTSDATLAMVPPNCAAALGGSSIACVEGTCRKGVFNFWGIRPRIPDVDIVAVET